MSASHLLGLQGPQETPASAFINDHLESDFLLVSEILLGYEEASWAKKLEISYASQILTNDRQILSLS